MSQQSLDGIAEVAGPADGELVHWMEPRPLRIGPAGVSATAAGAFLLGAGVAVAALALLDCLRPRTEVVAAPRRWRRMGRRPA